MRGLGIVEIQVALGAAPPMDAREGRYYRPGAGQDLCFSCPAFISSVVF
jgi:hypothetical protein